MKKAQQLLTRYELAVKANERQDVQQRLWEEYVFQCVIEMEKKHAGSKTD